MPSEDITFCMNDKCEEINCIRNPKRIRMLIPHSFAWLEGTEDCLLKKENNNNEGSLCRG